MKYLCLIYSEEKQMGAMSGPQLQALMGEYNAFTQSVQESGQLLGANRLQPTRSATTVRVREGKVSTTDGPFAETKEQLGGYYLIEATDLNAAIQVASRIPTAKLGCIEVRPIFELPPAK
jgi:hypothetical protein